MFWFHQSFLVSDRTDRQTDRRTDGQTDRQTDRRNKYVLGLPCFKKLSSEWDSIPLVITTLGILGASVRTCKPLYAYVLPHNIPVSRLENLYVYLTTTYYLYIIRTAQLLQYWAVSTVLKAWEVVSVHITEM